MSEEYPEALQIEVTNRCNFNCQMCIRRVWNAKPLDMDLRLYRKIAKTTFPKLQRLILYGFGEPLINPNILEMLRIARKQLPKDGQIIISTNGSLLSSKLSNKILKEIGIDSISFSIDTMNEAKLDQIREGCDPMVVMKNFRHVAEIKDKAERNFRLGVEAVIIRDNFSDFPYLVKNLAENNADYIILSHVIPYTREVFAKSVYVTLSKPSFEIIKSSLDFGWRLIRESSQETFSMFYGVNVKLKSAELVKEFWNNAEKSGYWINLPLLFNSKDRIEIINQVEDIFRQSQKIAREYQVNLKLPNLYPDAKERKCPYIEKNVMVIRSDGLAVPCLEFMYPHPMYINLHEKNIREISFGNLRKMRVKDVWKRGAYVDFRNVRKNMPTNIPWCGDCPYSTLGCYYTSMNETDCYANEPGCSECLYSVNLAQCNI